MVRRYRHAIAVATVAVMALAAPALGASEPLGLDALKTYNLVVLGDLTSTSEVEGRTFVGGNLGGSASNYLISSSVPASNFTTPGLTVVGSVTSSSINLNNAAGASVGGNISGMVNLNGTQTLNVGGTYTPVNVNGSTVNTQVGVANPGFVQGLQQYGSAMGTSMTGLSYTLGQQAANSTVSIANNTATFNAQPNAGGTAVFNLTAAQLDSVGQIDFKLNGADTVIVNVSGSTINLNDNFLGNASQLGKNVIWN
ncbi:choice-of-anchor A family protein, partial [Novosphingobium sp.]